MLTLEEEQTLVEHIEIMAQLGYGVTNKRLQHLGGDLAFDLGRKKQNTPMSNNWLYGFLARWKTKLASLNPRKLETNRARSSTPESVDSYFENLAQTLTKYNLTNKPQFIYNLDETGIQPDHRPPNVIAPIGSKPQAVTSPRSTTTTLIGCANALGNALPPYFVFKGKRFNPDLMKGASPGAKGVMSETGWSNGQVFKDYLMEHFIPFVRGGADHSQPVLLIYDGHASHISPSLIEWAKEHSLILFVLPAHTSHILQPLDVAIFGPFKSYYYTECAMYMQRHMGQKVTRYDMAKIASKAYLKAMTPLNIQSAFRKTGIFPLSREAIPNDKLLPCESFREDKPLEKVKAVRAGRDAVEEFLRLKLEKQSMQAKEPCNCACSKKSNASVTKPKAGGRAITDEDYIAAVIEYEQQKTDNKLNTKSKKTQKPTNVDCDRSPQPCTSGLNIHISGSASIEESDVDTDDEIDDTEPCCVCQKITPPNLREHPDIKIVNWAQCDKCSLWVHLALCTKVRVVRRHSAFLCPHCDH